MVEVDWDEVIDWDDDLELQGGIIRTDFGWELQEENIQRAALGWFLLWRRFNPFILLPGDYSGHFTTLPPDRTLWLVMRERMTAWAIRERDEHLDLWGTWNAMLDAHNERMKTWPARKPTDFPVGAGIIHKEYSHVRKPK